MNTYSSKLLENAVDELSRLPGIGRRTALRLALHLLGEETTTVDALANALTTLRNEIKYCRSCHNLSDSEMCDICRDSRRNREIICVVEDIRDVMAIEKTNQYRGLYHVLGGIISPMDGIGPKDLTIDSLLQRVQTGEVKEVIFALAATIEGDTTNYYLYKQIKGFDVKVTTIARGVSVGDELEYADEVTLGRSIITRYLYENAMSR
ncbi:MAG: recombination mediator RecR [Bacteroidales bacterium]|jgi:recombination protein RecR|nr:recombination mediator RecR [Bacteroidales bacterium]NCU37177.1 recombination protein RecR [Candidatus Falkowbacteria bacterium]MDD2633444.1 recombination mediator RecR [Bacteroidales bacterium]MDD3131712.1 recombination mediator RecR [Bacteroidales bacterium]MDD3525598.1 recombination mediator RecR [Bacteroidales bacterium]